MKIGTIVSTPAVLGFVDHVGIVSQVDEHGRPTHVISNSEKNGRVAEERIEAFSSPTGRWDTKDYPGILAPEDVVARARAEFGRLWTLLDNCEHFVRRVHGIAPSSPQLAVATVVGGLAATLFAMRARE